jgi:hypothetical protein
MTLDWVKMTDLVDDATAAALSATESRLNMARAASYANTRQRLETIYDRLWTLACRVSRALNYRGKHARRMRKRLEDGDRERAAFTPPEPPPTDEQPAELPDGTPVDHTINGHGTPRKIRRRRKAELAEKIKQVAKNL